MMDLFLFLSLLLASAFFSGSETAFFSLSALDLSKLRESTSRRAQAIVGLRAHPHELLITILFGNELVNIAISVVSAGIFQRVFHDLPLATQAALSSLFVIPTLLILGEITPKTYASYAKLQVASLVVLPLQLFSKLTTPIRCALHWISDALIAQIRSGEGVVEEEAPRALDDDAFRKLVDAGARDGVVEAQEQTLIHNLLDFDELTVSQVMRPWSEVCWLSSNAPLEEVFARLEGQPFSRIPVLASAERVIGIVYTKTLLAARWGLAEPRPLTELLRSPLLTRPEEPADALMERLRADRTHMAVVVDETHQPVGLCTLEDLLEELFGPIDEDESLSEARGENDHD
ncbi:MAG: hemolysin family protein [Myxococcota bacterium]|nr:hemolysin family protein [Myxococcota bacterium]